jgi:RNA polymerase sigma-70 factor (ECF subfamily)
MSKETKTSPETFVPDSTRQANFAEFYDVYLPKVYGYVRQRVNDTLTAEDLTATVFEKALTGWNGRRNPASQATWLFRIARNTIASHYRRKKTRCEMVMESPDDKPAVEPGPEDSLIQSERWALIQDSMRRLSRRERDIIALKFGGGLTNRAIGPIMGVSESNVAVIVYRSLRKLQAALESEQETTTLKETQ